MAAATVTPSLTLTTRNQIWHFGCKPAEGVYPAMPSQRPGRPAWVVDHVDVQFLRRDDDTAPSVTVSLLGHDLGDAGSRRSATYTGDPATWPRIARDALRLAQSTVDGAGEC